MGKTFEEKLNEVGAMGKKAADLIKATSDLIGTLSSGEAGPLLTGDPVADAAILRAKGVEEAIKKKFKVDLDTVLNFLYLLLEGGKVVGGLMK